MAPSKRQQRAYTARPPWAIFPIACFISCPERRARSMPPGRWTKCGYRQTNALPIGSLLSTTTKARRQHLSSWVARAAVINTQTLHRGLRPCQPRLGDGNAFAEPSTHGDRQSARPAVGCCALLGRPVEYGLAFRFGPHGHSTKSSPPQSDGSESKIVSESVHGCPHGSRNEH
jgi:hypothetical protein